MDCIVSVAVGGDYPKYAKRLLNGCKYYDVDRFIWIDKYPPGARPHLESVYGFKIHAIKYALEKGYNNILWCDSPCNIVYHPKAIFEMINEKGYYIVRDANKLRYKLDGVEVKHMGDDLLEYLGVDDDWARKINLTSGTMWGVNPNHPVGKEIYEFMLDCELKTKYDLNRGDEPLLSYLVDRLGLQTHSAGHFFQLPGNCQTKIISNRWL